MPMNYMLRLFYVVEIHHNSLKQQRVDLMVLWMVFRPDERLSCAETYEIKERRRENLCKALVVLKNTHSLSHSAVGIHQERSAALLPSVHPTGSSSSIMTYIRIISSLPGMTFACFRMMHCCESGDDLATDIDPSHAAGSAAHSCS